MAGRGHLTNRVESTMTKGTVRCKQCQKVFAIDDWLKNTVCDNPDKCGCPEVNKSMAQANAAINKAKQAAGYTMTKAEFVIPTNRDETVDQLYVSVSPVMQITLDKHQRGRKRV